MNSENVLEIRDLCVDFRLRQGIIRAVDHVSFDVPRGTVTALVGESGSGKSTLASAALQLVSHPGVIEQGSVLFGGRDVLSMKEKELQEYRWSSVSMVFQAAQNSLNPVMRIEEHMIETARSHGMMDKGKIVKRASELLDYVRLEPKRVLHAYPHELSGGMKQRVMIAFSLLLQPQLVILDEPTTALDVITQEYIFEILLKVHRELNVTMLLLSHDIAVVAKVADRIGVMYAGKMVEVGDTFAMFDEPHHPYTDGLIHAAPSLVTELDAIQSIPGSPPNLLDLPTGCPFHPRCAFVTDDCRSRVPDFQEFSEGRKVACHHHSQWRTEREAHWAH